LSVSDCIDTNSRPVDNLVRVVTLLLLMVVSVPVNANYSFSYQFVPGSTFNVQERSQQNGATGVISSFRKTIEFRVSAGSDSEQATLTAQILSLSNQGRRIDYYEGVIFSVNITSRGEIRNYSYSGGLPQYSALIQAAGPANRSNIFWMPTFPDSPMNIGDTFTHSAATGGAGMAARGETTFELAEVNGDLATFRLQQTGSLSTASVGGSENSTGSAVFNMAEGMWVSMDLNGTGVARMPGLPDMPYTESRHKEISAECSECE
jgi:hypothetical protein